MERTYDEAYDALVGGIIRCWKKGWDKLPENWQNEII